ncbi:MAG TPA: hypothetical protein VLH12_08495 [Usitatibacter sp.]|nr:hypothetical protein [Usitatibacter sp.]
MSAIPRSPHDPARDWTEDFEHENGNYYCSCVICGQEFFGHKRRVVCKVCAAPPAEDRSEGGQ